MTALTIEMLLKAKEQLESALDDREPPVYVAPAWIYDDPVLLAEFTRIAHQFHPGEMVEVLRQQRLPDAP